MQSLIELTPTRQRIYDGLKQMREDIAAFYKDMQVVLSSPDITSKSNLLAHLMREIDGGIRDVFKISIPNDKKRNEELITKIKPGSGSKSMVGIISLTNEDVNSGEVVLF